MNARATLDHIVIGADSLAQGTAFIEERLGAAMQAGGRHLAMGTHNCLLKLGERVYLEVIAIDPHGKKPARPRWFGLDEVTTRQSLAESPRLLTWAARTSDIEAAASQSPLDPGTVHSMARGAYTWRITIPDDGRLVCDGQMPTLIQWDGDAHPADKLEDRGCSLVKLEAGHPAPAQLESALKNLGLTSTLTVERAQRAMLSLTLRGPRGTCVLTS